MDFLTPTTITQLSALNRKEGFNWNLEYLLIYGDICFKNSGIKCILINRNYGVTKSATASDWDWKVIEHLPHSTNGHLMSLS